jgi:hypothetical protein
VSEVIEKTEEFIQRYYDLELIVSAEARKFPTMSKKMFADLLGNAMVHYIANRDGDEPTKKELAFNCFSLITKAYSNGFILPGQDLLRRLTECEKKNGELLKDLATCIANYSALQEEHQRLTKMLEDNQDQGLKNENKQGQDGDE